jgi:hypothetical protein
MKKKKKQPNTLKGNITIPIAVRTETEMLVKYTKGRKIFINGCIKDLVIFMSSGFTEKISGQRLHYL